MDGGRRSGEFPLKLLFDVDSYSNGAILLGWRLIITVRCETISVWLFDNLGVKRRWALLRGLLLMHLLFEPPVLVHQPVSLELHVLNLGFLCMSIYQSLFKIVDLFLHQVDPLLVLLALLGEKGDNRVSYTFAMVHKRWNDSICACWSSWGLLAQAMYVFKKLFFDLEFRKVNSHLFYRIYKLEGRSCLFRVIDLGADIRNEQRFVREAVGQDPG